MLGLYPAGKLRVAGCAVPEPSRGPPWPSASLLRIWRALAGRLREGWASRLDILVDGHCPAPTWRHAIAASARHDRARRQRHLRGARRVLQSPGIPVRFHTHHFLWALPAYT
ncbi:hypothetical protein ACU4HD_46605 [Cupriavidus basilensis]